MVYGARGSSDVGVTPCRFPMDAPSADVPLYRLIAAAALLACACGEVHGPADAAPSDGAPFDAPGPVDARPIVDSEPLPDLAGPSLVRCGAHECADGLECCYSAGECFDPATPGACAGEPESCASNEDCPAGELCQADAGGCLGTGTCQPPRVGCSPRPVCACDGRTYPSLCAAENDGVRVAVVARVGGECGTSLPPTDGGGCRERPCPDGEECRDGTCVASGATPLIACGVGTECPDGMECCDVSGVCVELSCETCCREPDPGGLLACESEAHCLALGFDAFCDGPGCAGSGSCIYPPSSCDGVFEPVCGCDGRSYSNACGAQTERVRVETESECE